MTPNTADMVGNLLAKVATGRRAEAGDLCAATRMAPQAADARICMPTGRVAGPEPRRST
jgi:hypothetical protein